MPAEILVSKMQLRQAELHRLRARHGGAIQGRDALKDSEARYRVLVENAPEAVVVFDVESGRFVDCNDNAAEFFKMTRDELLRVGPEEVSPPEQADGTPSFGVARGYVQERWRATRRSSNGCTAMPKAATSPAKCASYGCRVLPAA